MKRFVRMVGKSSAATHIADTASSTYCQFEKTTRRKLQGYTEKPPGPLCINCVNLQRGRAPMRPAAPVHTGSDVFLDALDRAGSVARKPVIDLGCTDPPWGSG